MSEDTAPASDAGADEHASGQPAQPGILEVSADFIGNYDPSKLDEAEEIRRRELFQTAVACWQLGFRVIPVHDVAFGRCSCDDPDCESQGKHPAFADWQKPGDDAGADCEWWRQVPPDEILHPNWRPRANLGVLTGRHSNVFVVDIDPVHGGWETWQRLTDSHLDEPIPSTRIIATGSGGRHYYFRYPEFTVRNCNPWGRGAGIDIRGDGGQVVAPPSISARGPYQVVDDSSVAEAPAWLLAALEEHSKIQRGEPSAASPRVVPTGIRRAYGQAAIRAQAQIMREAPAGDRNNTLNRTAFALGQLAPAAIVTEAEAWAALSDAASAAGLSPAETLRTFQSGWRKGMLSPFAPDWNEEERDFPARTWDDFGLGDRVADHFADVLRWNPDTEAWMVYQAGVWLADKEAGEVLAQAMIASLPDAEGGNYEDDPEAEDREGTPRMKFFEQCRKWRSATAPVRAAKVASRMPLMRVRQRDFDRDPLLLNLRNGVWDAREHRLLAHEPDQLMTLQGGVAYDPAAQCPLWDEFFERVQPDPEIRAYLYRVWGYSLTAELTERALFLHHGDGANGKSVANNIIAFVAGSYAQTVPVETLLLSGHGGTVPTDIARMNGMRYLSAAETRAGRQLNEALIKQLTGGDTVAARFMRMDFFEFAMKGKIHVYSNHLVHISSDPATHGRIHLIKWGVSIPKDEQDKHLTGKICESEAGGVLNRLLFGLDDWLARGDLCVPGSAEEEKREYVRSEDWRVAFVEECCEIAEPLPGAAGRSVAELYAVYKLWHHATQPSGRPMSINSFSAELGALHERIRSKQPGNKTWRGFPGLQVKPFPSLS